MLLFVPLSCINDKFEVYHQPISVPVVARLIKLLICLNGLLEMWIGLQTSYFRSLKGSQKIFLGRNLASG